MEKVLVTEQNLADIATAIRQKNGESTRYKPREMAAAISSLPLGSGVLEPLNVTANGIYTPGTGVDGFGNVTVAVPVGTRTFAFATVISFPGRIITATDGVTTLTGDDSGNYVFALPNEGNWAFSDGVRQITALFSTFGESRYISLSMFCIDQDYSSDSGLTLEYSADGSVLTASWIASRTSTSGFIFHLDGPHQKVRVSPSGTGTKQLGTCTNTATVPDVSTQGSGRGSYYTGSSVLTASSNYPRFFCVAYGMTVGNQVSYRLELVE